MPLIKTWFAGNGCSLVKSHNAEQGMLEAPNILNSNGQTEACLPADCVIKTDCKSATVAF
jgi:hypothetical protein